MRITSPACRNCTGTRSAVMTPPARSRPSCVYQGDPAPQGPVTSHGQGAGKLADLTAGPRGASPPFRSMPGVHPSGGGPAGPRCDVPQEFGGRGGQVAGLGWLSGQGLRPRWPGLVDHGRGHDRGEGADPTAGRMKCSSARRAVRRSRREPAGGFRDRVRLPALSGSGSAPTNRPEILVHHRNGPALCMTHGHRPVRRRAK
jgi:hypothetical protein